MTEAFPVFWRSSIEPLGSLWDFTVEWYTPKPVVMGDIGWKTDGV